MAKSQNNYLRPLSGAFGSGTVGSWQAYPVGAGFRPDRVLGVYSWKG
jgi:hypothetical protein